MNTTAADLRQIVTVLTNRTGQDHVLADSRLYAADGVTELSPRLPKAQLYQWISAYLDGWDAACRRIIE